MNIPSRVITPSKVLRRWSELAQTIGNLLRWFCPFAFLPFSFNIPVDGKGRMIPEALEKSIVRSKAEVNQRQKRIYHLFHFDFEGFHPFFVCATAGTNHFKHLHISTSQRYHRLWVGESVPSDCLIPFPDQCLGSDLSNCRYLCTAQFVVSRRCEFWRKYTIAYGSWEYFNGDIRRPDDIIVCYAISFNYPLP